MSSNSNCNNCNRFTPILLDCNRLVYIEVHLGCAQHEVCISKEFRGKYAPVASCHIEPVSIYSLYLNVTAGSLRPKGDTRKVTKFEKTRTLDSPDPQHIIAMKYKQPELIGKDNEIIWLNLTGVNNNYSMLSHTLWSQNMLKQ